MTNAEETKLRETKDIFKELTKSLKITKISELYPLIANNNPNTLAINHMLINDLVCEVIMSIYE